MMPFLNSGSSTPSGKFTAQKSSLKIIKCRMEIPVADRNKREIVGNFILLKVNETKRS
jgi:hypothetical protein